MDNSAKLVAATELLQATKRNLQLLDEHIGQLQSGRQAVVPVGDVSSEHRSSWLGALDDIDQAPGIFIGPDTVSSSFGWENAKTGTIRNEQDAAFVCTGIFCTWGETLGITAVDRTKISFVSESPYVYAASTRMYPFLRLIDGSSGKNLITGMTEGPKDLDRGAVPFEYVSSIRSGLGSNFKNSLFSEFTIPRSGVVRVDVFNMGIPIDGGPRGLRALVTMFGYKVYGA